MTSTGSGSAYSAITSKPAGSTVGEQRRRPAPAPAAAAAPRGRGRRPQATGRRSRVCSGGSFSIIWLRCSRLNGSR